MIQTTITHHCRKCGSANILLNGHNRYGKQQYLCKDCRCCRVLEPTSRGYSEEEKERALRVYQERASLRGAERALGTQAADHSKLDKKKYNRFDR